MLSLRRASFPLALAALAAACSHNGSSPPPALQVVSQLPPPEATGASRSPEVLVTLTKDIDPASVALGQIVVSTAMGPVVGMTEVDGPRGLRWTTSRTLPWGTVVSVTLLGGVRSLSGTALAVDRSWRFRVQDALLTSQELPIAALDPFHCVVASVPARQEFVVGVGPDVWVVPDLPLGGLTPLPHHEAIPFVPEVVAAGFDGAVTGAMLSEHGTSTAHDLFLVLAQRHADGTWQNEDFELVRGPFAALARFVGGRSGACTAQVVAESGAGFWLVGPRPTPPTFALFQNLTTTTPITVTALDLDTAVVCRESLTPGQPARFQWVDMRSSAPVVTRTWEQPFGLLASDHGGNLLVLSQSGTAMTLELQGPDGTVAGSATAAVEPPLLGLSGWRILSGSGTAAAILVRSSGCASFRLDAGDPTPQLRTFALPQDTVDTGAWEACYSPNGDLLVVARVRATPESDGSLFLWQQRPGSDWESSEILPEVQGRALGLPGIAVDRDGKPLFAVPRSPPAFVVVIQGRAIPGFPAPR